QSSCRPLPTEGDLDAVAPALDAGTRRADARQRGQQASALRQYVGVERGDAQRAGAGNNGAGKCRTDTAALVGVLDEHADVRGGTLRGERRKPDAAALDRRDERLVA